MTTETDRELLELAAKAMGLKGFWVERVTDWDSPHHGGPALQIGSCSAETWNPLDDDGDVFRLAVKLRIEVDYYLADVQAKHDDCDPVFELFSEHADHYAATRRAIVRAAVEIGRSMK